MIDAVLLDQIIVGRVKPHIYAFCTNTIPNYLKVGDTYRPVSVRLKEWESHFPDLEKKFEETAVINDDVYFRDFAVHQFLEEVKNRERLSPSDILEGIYYSKEFFKEATAEDLKEAILDIKRDYQKKTQKYQYYNAQTLKAEETVFPRTETYDLRPNQAAAVQKFNEARNKGRTNLLMYAVMRFGKSFTSMCCAVEMGAKLVVVVSAKAGVKVEWKKTVESHVKFADYDFLSSENLERNSNIITEKLSSGRKVVIFLTLQDLMGEDIKNKHKDFFNQKIDLLLVDETHFGARAEKYGDVFRNHVVTKVPDKAISEYEKDGEKNEDFADIALADNITKTLNANITVHLSGTPYRILMGSEFTKEDIIAFYQFTDIVDEQEAWDRDNKARPEADMQDDWENPYYGFPQMVRFAFHPNESARRRLEDLKKSGISSAFSELFRPQSIVKDTKTKLHKKFIYEQEVLDLLEVIDGSKDDDLLLGFLDYDKIKEGNMCRHIVVVLPYCASCDAFETLLAENSSRFKNLGSYEVINISGIDNQKNYTSIDKIKQKISSCEAKGKKTLTLTVNRMLTGSTVSEWDTMLFLKDTASPQEYDQAIFRLQSQFIKTFSDKNGNKIKYNMKPQTLLVDFSPNRMFVMQETKSKIYNANVDTGGNSELKHRIARELQISPIITINKDKIEQVTATDILEVVSNYNKDKGIKEEALEIPVDLSILENPILRGVIEQENEIGSGSGIAVLAYEGDEDDENSEYDLGNSGDDDSDDPAETDDGSTTENVTDKKDKEPDFAKKIQSYYVRLLLFAFLTKDTVISTSDIIEKMNSGDNQRIAKNLGLRRKILQLFKEKMNVFVLSDLDYKIQDLNGLSKAENLSPKERANIAISKFGKLGNSIVITPSDICDEMVEFLSDDFLKELLDSNGKILDIAGTSGEFAVSLCNRFTSLDVGREPIRNAIYTIPKSPICYELTRKVYELLGLNVTNISELFSSYNLLNIRTDKDIDYDKIRDIITQNKPFNTINLDDTPDEGDEKVKFDAIIGNPPYQTEGESTRKTPIYNLFYDISFALSDMVCLITPARFLFDAGQTPKKWNEKMCSDEHFKVAKYYEDARKVFQGVEIKGGIVISVRNEKENYGKINVFTPYEELQSILNKVLSAEPSEESFMDNIVSSRGNYRFSDDFFKVYPQAYERLKTGTGNMIVSNILEEMPESFYVERPDDGKQYLTIFGRANNERLFRYIERDYVIDNEYIDTYNVFISEANGTGDFGEELSTPFVGNSGEISTDTFISLGFFESKDEATALLKYIKCKFTRALLSVRKATQHTSKSVWKFVPIQDFSQESDINWDGSICDINQQLYKKYNLSEEEITFIENNVKEMT